MTRNDSRLWIEENKLIVIVRGLDRTQIVPTMEALYAGGVRIAEITFDATGAVSDAETEEMIRLAADAMRDRMLIGSGTVVRPSQAERTKRAGGAFVISPDTRDEVIYKTRALGLLSIPGAMTATEIRHAHSVGADFVKVFPAGNLGLAYFKSLKTPLTDVKLLAVAGIKAEDIPPYLAAGAAGFGVSGTIIKKDAIVTGNYAEITRLAKLYTEKL